VRSVDLGSLRLTRRMLDTAPPAQSDLDAARAHVEAAFVDLAPPLALAAIATGGSARALRRIVGAKLEPETLASAARKLAKRSDRAIANDYGVDRARARTLLAGTLILIEVQRRLGIRLQVGRGGIREGAALLALDELAAATG
jgi:exopolyphosphatase/pppGpp-phosphohydrolase